MPAKIFVTGAGIISALGNGLETTLQALMEGRSGVGAIHHLRTGHADIPAGEVAASNAEMAEMLGVGYPESELRTVLMGAIAAREALTAARLSDADVRRAAFISGTTVGGMDKTEECFRKIFESNAATDEVAELQYNDCGITTRLIARRTGHFAMMTTASTACSSAANAIILGANMIRAGMYDIVVAGGSEALTRFHLNGFNTLMILDRDRCRPFDRDRAGINLGEGAAYIVLESETSALNRGVTPLAELSGYANTCDAFHQTASSADGEGPYRAMSEALEMAGLTPADISYINAHGTGTPNNDASEMAAMKRIFGEKLPPFSSTKPLTGHATSAAGAIEAVICLLALREHFIPASAGFANPIDGGEAPVTVTVRDVELNHVISNSFGFGGNDSSLIFSRTKQ